MHVGLIGASSFGKNHLRAYQESSHISAISLAGRNLEKLEALQAEHPKVRSITNNFEDFFADSEIGIIDIVLPHDMHLPVAMAAMENGKHVICEKPPARTMDDALTMLEASREHQVRYFVIMNQLYNPVHRKIREVIDQGAIGQPFLAFEYGLHHVGVMTDQNNWRATKEQCGGGPMIDGGFHQIYRHLFFLESFGRPAWVTGDADQIAIDIPEKGEDFVTMTIGFDTGIKVQVTRAFAVPFSPPHGPCAICGTEGTIVLDGKEDTPFRIMDKEGDHWIPVDAGPRSYNETIPPCIHDYLECLKEGEEPEPGLPMAYRTLEIIEASITSSRLGERIHLRADPLAREGGN
ncbi:MAG: Gfo/Idh/MocA family oxidoreductase [Planctomycetota bacterium]|nr:Gfo/Idh/MocA family oxidoreductase [Planctomycetota bacterium]